jgi:hypothetical protein
MVASDETKFHTRLTKISSFWNGFLDDNTIYRWNLAGGRCDEIERFIEGACFLPTLSGRIEQTTKLGSRDHDAEIDEVPANNLDIAFDLFETMPLYNISAIAPKLSLATGRPASYAENPELAIRCYWEGL